ncbi:hypothetical protein OESDEN_04100 [Oesophagostomum dentatum]|uniref:Uncharacterized protein n=1 Tax=Oesophagostomum dentatum TaxID=61180 RepID=A0A0B1TIK5_OESDE|nr:hypothetical protein OESDEN_04100 [Oesophagostomum dentatum]
MLFCFRVIDTLNRAYDGRTKWRSNCMVFLTGMKNVTETKLQPWKNFRKTVVISLQGTDLSSITDERATVLNMSLPLSDTDVAVVLHSIIDDY